MVEQYQRISGTKRIALAFPAAQAHLHAILRGVTDYARQYGRWLLTTSVEEATLPIGSLDQWEGDGVIAVLAGEEDVKAAGRLRRRGIPVVTYSGWLRNPEVPRVTVDNAAIGRMAAMHLLARGFRSFGFYGLSDRAHAELRAKAFIAAVRAGGGQCAEHWCTSGEASRHRPWQDKIEPLARWVAGLKKPAGVFAANDFRARLVMDACQLRGVAVPREVGVLGADNNVVVCEFSDVPLSSVICDWRRVGVEAARLLDKLMRGEPPPRGDVLVPPLGVERRQSTDVLISDDPRVNRAVDYMREHLGDVFGVERVVKATGVSRRSLETAFRDVLGLSPARYMAEARVARAKELLMLPESLKMSEVARRCGFSDARRFKSVFRRVMGVSPAAYREAREEATRD
jgi:LacI family transcriptional regulator